MKSITKVSAYAVCMQGPHTSPSRHHKYLRGADLLLLAKDDAIVSEVCKGRPKKKKKGRRIIAGRFANFALEDSSKLKTNKNNPAALVPTKSH